MEIEHFSNDYKQFLFSSKTERRCVKEIVLQLTASGFRQIELLDKITAGTRVFKVIKGKTVLAAVVGRQSKQLRIIGSHVDSPKLDLKPEPFFEKGRLALLSLHDYGWIKPYQWVNVPLELHGIIFLKDGREVELTIGKEDGPVFSIPDIPPHISSDQLKQPMAEGFKVTQLNAIAGCLDKQGDSSALEKVYSSLKKEYGIEEADFRCADLCLVPHNRPIDVGFDGSMIGGYGQDDRVAVYTSLRALMECTGPDKTAVGYFVDKEEISSTGDTSAQSFVLRNFIRDLVRRLHPELKVGDLVFDADLMLEEAEALSADVTTAYDPNFNDKFDAVNTAYLGKGIVIAKYGGAGAGKFRANEARAEYMQIIREITDSAKIPWQTGLLARLGIGGGGTIAKFMSHYGMDCVDAGPCLLGMHSAFEIGSKKDFFNTYRFYKQFFES